MGAKNKIKSRFAALKSRAASSNIAFNLTIEEFSSLWPTDDKCPVLGVPFVHVGHSWYNPSVDKLIPSLGYTVGNVRIISKRANTIKGHTTDPMELRKIADWLEAELGLADKPSHGAN
jgi:hypothetical protein